jgi:hypothetical protein
MIDPTRQDKLDDPVLLDTVSTVLSGFIGVWDEPTKLAIQDCSSEGVSNTAVQNEVLYLRAFTIVFGLGQHLGDTKIKSRLLERFQGRAANLLPEAQAFLGRATDYTTALEASDPADAGKQVGMVFAQHCGKHGDQGLIDLGTQQYSALSAVLYQFFLDATK